MQMNAALVYQQKLKRWRSIFLGSFAAYLCNNFYLYFGVAHTLSLVSILALLALKVLPLLAFFPWLLKPNYKAALGFSCLLCFYFVFTALAIFQEGIRGQLALIETLIFSVLFWSAFKLGKLH